MKKYLFFVAAYATGLLIACGTVVEITDYDVVALHEKYVTAEFSEVDISIDFETGMPETSTDSWNESASDVYLVVTVNGILDTVNTACSKENIQKSEQDFYYASKNPPVTENFSDDVDFDNYQNHENLKLYLHVYSPDIGEVTFSIEEYKKILEYRRLGKPLYINDFTKKISFETPEE